MKRKIVALILTICAILNILVESYGIGLLTIICAIVYTFLKPPTDTPSDPHPEHQMD